MPTTNNIDQILNSLTGASRPEASNYLLTRIHAELENRNDQSFSGSVITWLQRPLVALSFVIAVLIINVCVFTMNRSNAIDYSTAVKEQPAAFSLNVSSIYDVENSDQ